MMNNEGGNSKDSSIRRRRFLGGCAVATLPLLAGCTSVTENEFVATPVSMPSDRAEEIGYRELLEDQRTTVETDRFVGMTLETSLTHDYAVYEETAGGDDGAAPRVVGVLSTPKANVLGSQRNPFVRLSGQRLINHERARWFFEAMELEGIDEWGRTSSRIVSERTELFGSGDERLTTRAGFAGTDAEPSVLFVHYTKVNFEDDVVFGYAARRMDADDSDRPFVGEDGYLTDADFAADVLAAKTALNAVRYG